MRRFESRILSVLALAVWLIAAPSAARAFDGEQTITAAGFPALVKFIPGDPQRPLVVFIPGAHHTARIAYGGHPGGRAEDFLAYWLVKEGYNFLGVSYPIATRDGAITGAFPAYNARDWGRQAAEAAKQTIEAHHLTKRIIVIGWSMGGRIAEPVGEAAREQGLDLDFFVSFSATPGVTGLVGMTAEFPMTAAGYADRSNVYPAFYKQILREGEMNGGRTIIDETSYRTSYVGDMPVSLEGYGLHFRDGRFVRDFWADEEDFRVHAFGKLPDIAMFMPNDPLDARHALTDKGNWGLLIVNKIQADLDAAKVKAAAMPRDRWLALVDLVRSAPDRLSVEVNGDHFFFVGEAGARETARALTTMEARMAGFKADLKRLTAAEAQ